jgi:biopolymer transport protein ExbD
MRNSNQLPLLFFAALASLALAGCLQEGTSAAVERQAIVQPTMNTITINGSGRLRWNDADTTLDELTKLLDQTRKMQTEPQLQLLPSVDAPYDTLAEVLRVIKQSGVTKFGFVGNEKYHVPDPSED